MKIFEEVDCLICNSQNYEILSKKGKLGFPINVSICKECGFVYLNPRWIKKEYDIFYKEMYDIYFDRHRECSIDNKRYSTIVERINNVTNFNKDNQINILDIGSGMGNGISEFKKEYKNASLFAIESSKKCQSNLEKKGIKNISNDIDSDWEEVETKFDIIIMRHVLEHCLNPEETLSKIYKTLSDKGYLYIAIPNIDCAGYPLTKTFRVVHTLYFSEKNLKFLLKKNGFETIITENNFGEMFMICRKTTKEDKEIDFNDYESSKKRINNLLKKEKQMRTIIYWKIRIFIGNLIRRVSP